MLRQVSITGLVATGMTIVILLGGIDLSVGSVMGCSTIICAMLLTRTGMDARRRHGRARRDDLGRARCRLFARFVFNGLARGRDVEAGRRRKIVLGAWRGLRIPCCWVLPPGRGRRFRRVASPGQIRGAGGPAGDAVLLADARRDQQRVHRRRTAAAVHRDARDDGQRAGHRRFTGGQDNAVIPVYTGTNATENFEILRSMVGGFVPMPSIFFLVAIIGFGAVLRFTTFGRYVYAIGGNVEAAKLSGVKVAQVQFSAYVISGMLAGLAGVLFVAQYRQGKPDAGSGLELDAIAAVVIGGTSLMGGRGGLAGTFVGVLIFGLLSDILQLQNIDFQRSAPDERADHRRDGAGAGTESRSASSTRWRGGPSATAPPRTRIGRHPSAA